MIICLVGGKKGRIKTVSVVFQKDKEKRRINGETDTGRNHTKIRIMLISRK